VKILAIDSTAATASVAICDGDKLLSLWTHNNGLTHSESLLPMVESLLKYCGLTVDDIELFAVSAGPGSFTGVRIGAATVKGLAYGRNIPCIGVSTLDALAYNLICCDGIVCPAMNARRDQVYTALFESDGGNLNRLTPDSAISLSELSSWLEKYPDRKIFVCGDGYELVRKNIKNDNIQKTPEHLVWQNAYSVAQCAKALYESGVRTTDRELTPTYLRMPQAERERLEKLKNENK